MNDTSPNPAVTAEMLQAEGPKTIEDTVVAKLKCDRAQIKEKNILRSRCIDIGFKESRFEDCVFNHTHFERCYFRKAILQDVNFTGCVFRDCRFDEAEFVNCHFDYAEFQNCSVTYEQIAPCLPTQENILWKLARNLRVNAQNRGQTEDYRKFLLKELNASEAYNWKKAFAWTDPYYKKYRRRDRIKGFISWISLKSEGFFWGHGEIPTRVIRSAAIIILAFALLFRYLKVEIENMPSDSSLLEYIGLSTAMFATVGYGNFVPASFGARLLAAIEGALGLITFGFLAAALYRRISKR